jgi:sialate O-acetylesterase
MTMMLCHRNSLVRTLLTIATISLSSLNSALADVQLPNVFSDSMVLQRDQKNRVWGRAEAGEKVTVSIAKQSHQATADADGNWHVMLSPMSVGKPLELKVQGNNEVTFSDVLVGEVWICSGQSNMAMTVNSSNAADLERAAANFPQIRMINFPRVGTQEAVWTHEGSSWMVCSPETVGQFSAVGYFFGRQLYESIDVPIGLINNAWGGSACEAWVNRDLLKADPAYAPMLERWAATQASADALAAKPSLNDAEKKQLANLKRRLSGNQNPSNIYNGVLKSHLGYGIRGAIWYQGESNAGRAYQYRHLFPLMISNWREEWGQGDFPFYWVQLADFRNEVPEPGDSSWAELREAQTMTMDKLANTGEAVIIDTGEGYDIHPKNKQTVGRRLARWALAKDYGIDIAHQSPRFKSMEKSSGAITLTFAHVAGGWRPFDVREPRGFAIAGEDKKFVWAQAKILKDGRIEVSSPQVSDPASVRYGWAENPVLNMFNNASLPLTPFRTDDWPGITIDAK